MANPTPMIEQVQEILATLAFALDNLIEAVGPQSNNSFPSSSIPARSSSPNTSASPSKQTPKVPRVRKFQRPGRRILQSKTPSPATSPVHQGNEAPRKRSWDSNESNFSLEEQDSLQAPESSKRSKSIVLLQEMEGLRVSSPPSLMDSELSALAEQDLQPTGDTLNCCMHSLAHIRTAEQLIAELEAINRLEDILDALMTLSSPLQSSANRVQFTHWCKWRLIPRFSETFIAPKEVPFKVALTRVISLGRALNSVSGELDWRDPELTFLLFKMLAQILMKHQSYDYSSVKSTAQMHRRMDEFMGLLRGFNLICILLWNRVPRSIFALLAAQTGEDGQISEFFELLLEDSLNLFELTSLMNGNLNLSLTFSLLFLHFGQLFVPSTSTCALLEKIHKYIVK